MIIDNRAHSLEESVYYTLEEEILSGKLREGDTLAEISLSKRLGVSRTPLRAAIHRLAEEGLVTVTPNKGATVRGVSPDDLMDIYKIRMRLEGLASAEAAQKITEEDLASLSESVELSRFYISRNDSEKLKELDTEFHNIIYRASGNRLLSKILSELHRNIRAYRKLSLSVPSRIDKSVDEHGQILDAIARHDADEADRLTKEHISAALDNLLLVASNK